MSKSQKSIKKILLPHIVDAIEEVKGEEITILDMREIDNVVFDYFVICQANSNVQVQAIWRSVLKRVPKFSGEKPFHIEGTENSEWVIVDYGDIIVHIFQKQIRERYKLEELWGDAKVLEIEELSQVSAPKL